ncbi:MAG: DUF1569 domain-containing protein [Flavobacteriales bacterium]
MDNLFHHQTQDIVIQRIQRLTPESQPTWGKMNAAQMLRHCEIILRESLGTPPLKRMWLGYIFGARAKKKFLSASVFKPGEYTAPRMVVLTDQNFQSAKDDLIHCIHGFCQQGPEKYDGRLHRFFGVMTADEWGTLQFNHLNHHLTQFAL